MLQAAVDRGDMPDQPTCTLNRDRISLGGWNSLVYHQVWVHRMLEVVPEKKTKEKQHAKLLAQLG